MVIDPIVSVVATAVFFTWLFSAMDHRQDRIMNKGHRPRRISHTLGAELVPFAPLALIVMIIRHVQQMVDNVDDGWLDNPWLRCAEIVLGVVFWVAYRREYAACDDRWWRRISKLLGRPYEPTEAHLIIADVKVPLEIQRLPDDPDGMRVWQLTAPPWLVLRPDESPKICINVVPVHSRMQVAIAVKDDR